MNGISGLFTELSAVAWRGSLMQFSLMHSLDSRWGPRRYTIGVNGSALVEKLIQSSANVHSSSSTPFPEVEALCTTLSQLAHTPATFLFVFDSIERPTFGFRSRLPHRNTLIAIFEDFIASFGFEHRTATGEGAESELARLNQCAFVDAVLSVSGDALLFGARTVLNWVGEVDEYLVIDAYRANEIETHECIRLSRAGLILVALLAGGTYSRGVSGIGIKTAIALARYGLGEELLDIALLDPSAHNVPERLQEWKARLCSTLIDDPTGRIGCRSRLNLAKQVARLPAQFFNLDHVRTYLHPQIYPLSIRPVPGHSLIPRLPNLDDLIELFSRDFGWRDEELGSRLLKFVWPVLYMRKTYDTCDPNTPVAPSSASLRARGDPSMMWLSVPAVKVTCDASDYVNVLQQHVIDTGPTSGLSRTAQTLWFPTTVIRHLSTRG